VIKNALNLVAPKVTGTIIMLMSFADVFEPIYSIGSYIAFAFAVLLVYYLLLAKRYKTVDELCAHEKGFVGIEAFKEFYQKNWSSGVIILLSVLLCISLFGAYQTNQHKDEGGYLAANFPIIEEIQESLSALLKGQEDIKQSLDEVDNTTKSIQADTTSIRKQLSIFDGIEEVTVPGIVKEVKKKNGRFSALSHIFNSASIDYSEPYTAEDILYIYNIFSDRESTSGAFFFRFFMENCDTDSFTQDQMLKLVDLYKKTVGSKMLWHYLNFSKSHIERCTNGNSSQLSKELDRLKKASEKSLHDEARRAVDYTFSTAKAKKSMDSQVDYKKP